VSGDVVAGNGTVGLRDAEALGVEVLDVVDGLGAAFESPSPQAASSTELATRTMHVVLTAEG